MNHSQKTPCPDGRNGAAHHPVTKELPIPAAAPPQTTEYACDVLVVGGGMAGLFAALYAKDAGSDVLLVDKGYPGYSGQSPWAGCHCYFDPALGDSKEEYECRMIYGNEYLSNLNWARVWERESKLIYEKCRELGLLNQYPPAKETGHWVDGSVEHDRLVEYHRQYIADDRHAAVARALDSHGIPFVPQVMIMDVIEDNGKVTGAIGLHYKSGAILKFHAKAVILCTGSGTYKPSGVPISEDTYDGEYIGYMHGLPLTGQEFEDYHMTSSFFPGDVLALEAWKYLESCWLCAPGGGTPETIAQKIAMEAKSIVLPVFDSANGIAPTDEPVYKGFSGWGGSQTGAPDDPRLGVFNSPSLKGDVYGAAPGLYSHYAGGIFCGIDDVEGKTAVRGLWVAGDGTNGCMVSGGSKRCPIGMTSNFAGVQGKIAGLAAAAYAADAPAARMPEEKTRKAAEEILAPLHVSKGFHPNWARDILTSVMGPYWITIAKNEDALKSALLQVENLRDHVIPKLRANSGHDLRLCHEMRHKVLIAELKLRASLERKESRGYHYRTDYPYRDDDYLCYITLQKADDGTVRIEKVNIKDEWKGDTGLPYEKRYGAWHFPGELEALGKQGRD